MTKAELEDRMSVAEFFEWLGLANLEARERGGGPAPAADPFT